jgi:hypothetical protein
MGARVGAMVGVVVLVSIAGGDGTGVSAGGGVAVGTDAQLVNQSTNDHNTHVKRFKRNIQNLLLETHNA